MSVMWYDGPLIRSCERFSSVGSKPLRRSASTSSRPFGSALGEPKSRRASDPTTVPTPRATSTSTAGITLTVRRSSTITAMPPHAARRQRRDSHGEATVTMAVAAAT